MDINVLIPEAIYLRKEKDLKDGERKAGRCHN